MLLIWSWSQVSQCTGMDECGSDTLVCLTFAEKVDENWAIYCYAHRATLWYHACFMKPNKHSASWVHSCYSMVLRTSGYELHVQLCTSFHVMSVSFCSVFTCMHARGACIWGWVLIVHRTRDHTVVSHRMALVIHDSPWNCCTQQSVLRVADHVRPPFWDWRLLVRFRE